VGPVTSLGSATIHVEKNNNATEFPCNAGMDEHHWLAMLDLLAVDGKGNRIALPKLG